MNSKSVHVVLRWAVAMGLLLIALVSCAGDTDVDRDPPSKCLSVVESTFCKGLMPLKVCADAQDKKLPQTKVRRAKGALFAFFV
jgi:hypothetical protein